MVTRRNRCMKVLFFVACLMFVFGPNSFGLRDPFEPALPKPAPKRDSKKTGDKPIKRWPSLKKDYEQSEQGGYSGAGGDRNADGVDYELEDVKMKPDLNLTAVFWGAGEGVAIISGEVYYEGDRYGDECEISRILNGKLLLKCGDNVWEYTIKEELAI